MLEDYQQQSNKEISLQGETTVTVISKRDDGEHLKLTNYLKKSSELRL